MITLFEKVERLEVDVAKHNENTYDYYFRNARKDISIIRDTLNNWFNEYPVDEKKELKSRFKKSFDSAFYELFIFHFFKGLGFDIDIHPEVPGSTKRPDFLIKKGDVEMYVEAKVIKDKSDKEVSAERRLNDFYDKFSKIKTFGFLLKIDSLAFKTTSQPKTKNIITEIEDQLERLNYDTVIEGVGLRGSDGAPAIVGENSDLKIVVKPIPLISEARKTKFENPIGMYPTETFWGGGEDSLKKGIREKAKRYGKVDKPFLVCINALGQKTTMISAENSVWGSRSVSFSMDPDDKDAKIERAKDGIFLDKGGVRLKNLSGVFISKVVPFNIPVADVRVFEHPLSDNKFDFEFLGLPLDFVEDNRIKRIGGKELSEILGIENDWLK